MLKKALAVFLSLSCIYLYMLWPININDTQAHVKVIIVYNSRIPHFVLVFKRYENSGRLKEENVV